MLFFYMLTPFQEEQVLGQMFIQPEEMMECLSSSWGVAGAH